MGRQASESSIICRQFITENLEATYKDFLEKYPDTDIKSGYFAAMKSSMKKKNAQPEAAQEEEAAKPVEAKPKVKVVKPKAKSSNGSSMAAKAQEVLDNQIKFKTWLETGIGEGYIEKLKEYM